MRYRWLRKVLTMFVWRQHLVRRHEGRTWSATVRRRMRHVTVDVTPANAFHAPVAKMSSIACTHAASSSSVV